MWHLFYAFTKWQCHLALNCTCSSLIQHLFSLWFHHHSRLALHWKWLNPPCSCYSPQALPGYEQQGTRHVLQLIMLLRSQWFGQDISQIEYSTDVSNSDDSGCHCFSHFVVCHCIVFLFKLLIGNCALITTLKLSHRTFVTGLNLMPIILSL